MRRAARTARESRQWTAPSVHGEGSSATYPEDPLRRLLPANGLPPGALWLLTLS